MSDDLNRGIVLDYDLSMAFKVHAYKEGILSNNGKKLSQLGESDIKYNIYKNRKELAYTAYSSIVLFNKIYVQSHHNIRGNLSELFVHSVTNDADFLDYDDLVKEGAVNLIRYKPSTYISRNKLYRSERNRPEYRPEHHEVIDPVDFAMKKELLIQYVKNRASTLGERQYSKEIYERAYNILLHKFTPNLEDESGNNWAGLSLFEACGESPKLAPVFSEIYSGYQNLQHVINETNRLKCPGKSLIPVLEKASIPDTNLSEAAFRVYGIILEEQFSFPFPRTLSAAIKLRKDKRVSDFRENLFFWANSLLEDSLSSEAKLRMEIAKSGRELKKLSTYKTVGRIITFAALPIAVASALMQFPLGLFLIPLSHAIAIDSIRREKKHSWLIFGK
jgi:hypothetical protein